MTVYLVGAGPGDPGLLSVRGAQLLASADAVVHDRLVAPELLRTLAPETLVIDVGKKPGHGRAQSEINALLIELSTRLERVVRLKGGDPFLFGRGGEEALALQGAGVDFEVVPGISAAIAAPAWAGVPVTHRGLAGSVTIVTGHEGGASTAAHPGTTEPATEWEALARLSGTLVILMGVSRRGEIAARLIAGGRSASTPVMAVAWGTWPEQTVWRATLGELAGVPVRAPATIVVGEVASLRLDWVARRPLAGYRVVVLRARAQAPELSSRLASLGAVPIELPVIEIGDPSDGGDALRRAGAQLSSYEWVVLTSANGARRLLEAVPDARAFGAAKVAAIGPGTAAELAAGRIVADVVAQRHVSEGLLEALPPPGPIGGRVLLARAAEARDVLPQGLRAAGWTVDVVEAYRVRRAPVSEDVLNAAVEADVVCCTASSTVRGFLDAVGDRFRGRVACIGPVTAAEARRLGLGVDVEATSHSIDGLLEALAAAARHWGPPRRATEEARGG